MSDDELKYAMIERFVRLGFAPALASRVSATYQLVEIATGKIVLKDSTFANAGYDILGPQQRFAKDRVQVDAQNRAANLAAEAIRNGLASYFVAGTTSPPRHDISVALTSCHASVLSQGCAT
jgi:hypothetical protein